MLITNEFKDEIARTFYDKEFKLIRRTNTIDDDGGSLSTEQELGTYKGNAQYGANRRIIDELGLDNQVDLVITTTNSVEAKNDDIVEYNGIKYDVVDSRQRDSHLIIICNKGR